MLSNQSVVMDLRGFPAKVGDTIVLGFRDGNSSETRIGKIVGFKSIPQSYGADFNHYAQVEWTFTSSWDLPKKKTTIGIKPQGNNAFVVVSLPAYN